MENPSFFNKSLLLVAPGDIDLMSERIEIRSLIHKGLIDEAIEKIGEVSPKVDVLCGFNQIGFY